MARPLEELTSLRLRHGNPPVFYAGDVFDRWNAAPEVINFALAHLPPGYAIPGQHDLPDHVYGEIHRTAYWTLVEAGRLVNLPPGEPYRDNALKAAGITAYGYPWGFEPKPIEPSGSVDLAVVHRYIWSGSETAYAGAPETAHLAACVAALRGYAVAAFGDNHHGFVSQRVPFARGNPDLWVCNCGGIMRRKTDERDYLPGVGLLHLDGTVTRHLFDTTEDSFAEATEAEELVERLLDMEPLMAGLRSLEGGDALDFLAALQRFLLENEVPAKVARIIMAAHNEGGK